MSEKQQTDSIELALDEADDLAEHTTERMTHEEVFQALRQTITNQTSIQ